MIDLKNSIQSIELAEDYIEYFNRREINVKTIKNETNYISLYFQSLDSTDPNTKRPEFYLDEFEVSEQLINFGQFTFYFVDDNNLNFSHDGQHYSKCSRLLRLFCFAEVKHLYIVSKNPGSIKNYIEQQLMEQYGLIERLELQKIQTIKHISFDAVMDEIKKLKPIEIVKELQLECVFRVFGIRNKFVMVQVLKGILLPETNLLFDRMDQLEKKKVTDTWLSGIKELHNHIVGPNQFAMILIDKFVANIHIKGALAYDYRMRLQPAVPQKNTLECLIQCSNEYKKLDFLSDDKKHQSDCIIGIGKVTKTVTNFQSELDEQKNQNKQKVDMYKPYSLYQIVIALPCNQIGYSTHDQYPQISKILNSHKGLESQYYGKITKLSSPINVVKPVVVKQNVIAIKQDEKQTLQQLQPGIPFNGKKFYRCRLCKEQMINSFLVPCGHYRYCDECVGDQQQCLFCDQPIKHKIRLPLHGLDDKQYKLNKILLNQIIDKLQDLNQKLDLQVCLDWINSYNKGLIQLQMIDKCECNKYIRAYGQCAQKHVTYMCKVCFNQKKISQCKECQQGFVDQNMIIFNFHE